MADGWGLGSGLKAQKAVAEATAVATAVPTAVAVVVAVVAVWLVAVVVAVLVTVAGASAAAVAVLGLELGGAGADSVGGTKHNKTRTWSSILGNSCRWRGNTISMFRKSPFWNMPHSGYFSENDCQTARERNVFGKSFRDRRIS